MSRHHYEASKAVELAMYEKNWPFYSLIMAAMRRADDTNLALLQAAWPEVYEDLFARYNAPGGRLPGDPPWWGDIEVAPSSHFAGWQWKCRLCAATSGLWDIEDEARESGRDHLAVHALEDA